MRNFIEWGELESVRVIWDKSIAFVRYKLRAAAEFAKEAMADQSLGYREVINVRWANEDPNPRAKAEKVQGLATQVFDKVMSTQGPAPYPDMSTLTTGDSYPSTDGQYDSVERIPADYQRALQYATTYSNAGGSQAYDPTTAVSTMPMPMPMPMPAAMLPEEESALSMLAAYDAESYADRYGSPSSSTSSSSSSATTLDQQQTPISASAHDHQHSQEGESAEYTLEQWRQWYMYYYGYVPANIPGFLASGKRDLEEAEPTATGQQQQQEEEEEAEKITSAEAGGPAKKLRVV